MGGLRPDTHIQWVYLTVSDLEKAMKFYTGLLGLKHLSWLGEKVVLGSPDGEPLIILRERRGALPWPGNSVGLYHLALLMPSRKDLARIFVRISENWGFEGFSDHIVSEALYLRDPDGHGLEIYVDRPKSFWSYRSDGGLQMATLPLNIDSLLRELAGEGVRLALSNQWRAPAGTRVGHIHLHVSRLEKAERFYHQLLGFDVTMRLANSALFMAVGGYHHHIGANIWAGLDAPRASQEHVSLESFSINLMDIGTISEIKARIVENGLEVDDGLLNSIEGYSGVTVRDYDGNVVELVAPAR
ncbi:Catechol-2,3-dioxygenase [archaeon HR01]|nr:Catechol-2,3-dioxygenase [archaeon HR01]